MPTLARPRAYVIVPGAWDTPAIIEPLLAPLEAAGNAVIVVDLPCEDADATLDHYADAVRTVLPDDLSDVVLFGYSFGGFTATRIALEHPGLPVAYIAAGFRNRARRCSTSSWEGSLSRAGTRRQGWRRSAD